MSSTAARIAPGIAVGVESVDGVVFRGREENVVSGAADRKVRDHQRLTVYIAIDQIGKQLAEICRRYVVGSENGFIGIQATAVLVDVKHGNVGARVGRSCDIECSITAESIQRSGDTASLDGFSGNGTLYVTASTNTGANIPMFHVDQNRSGLNSNETILTPNKTPANFGKLFSYLVDGYVYGQPLVISNLTIGGTTHNVLFAATENDTVYAFDADSNPGAMRARCGRNCCCRPVKLL